MRTVIPWSIDYTTRVTVQIQNLEKTILFKITTCSLNTFQPKLIQTLLIFYFESFMNDVKETRIISQVHVTWIPYLPRQQVIAMLEGGYENSI